MEGDLADEEFAEGEQMHIGARLSEMRLEQRLSIDQPWLTPLHDLKVELNFHYRKIRETWGRTEIITIALGFAALFTGSTDLASGEFSGGGDIWKVGIDGLNAITWQAFAMMIMSVVFWVIFLFRILGEYPLMREKTLYLFIGLGAVQIGIIVSHADNPKFPLGSSFFDFVGLIMGASILGFLSFNTWQAVAQTRDVHVENQHGHPDPRKMEAAMRDHSLVAWCAVLVFWCLTVIIFSWFGAHSVAFRDSTNMWLYRVFYVISGTISVFALIHVLWYPQLMLGSAGQEIESHRSREVSRKLRGEDSVEKGQRGTCPTCGGATPVKRNFVTGMIEVVCLTDDCDGVGAPDENCESCSTKFPKRISCDGCGTSAPISDHFPDDEAW